jgi:hypothetical protein
MENVRQSCGKAVKLSWGASLLGYATATGFSNATFKDSPLSTFQGIVDGTGTVTATVAILGSNDDLTGQGTATNWVTLGTITLSGITTATDGFSTEAPWKFVAAQVTAVSGTGTQVRVLMGV